MLGLTLGDGETRTQLRETAGIRSLDLGRAGSDIKFASRTKGVVFMIQRDPKFDYPMVFVTKVVKIAGIQSHSLVFTLFAFRK